MPNRNFPGVFSKYHYFVVRISEAAMCGEHYIYIWVPRSSFIRMEILKREGVDRLIIVYYIPNIIKMNVHSATSICSIELYSRSSGMVYFG